MESIANTNRSIVGDGRTQVGGLQLSDDGTRVFYRTSACCEGGTGVLEDVITHQKVPSGTQVFQLDWRNTQLSDAGDILVGPSPFGVYVLHDGINDRPGFPVIDNISYRLDTAEEACTLIVRVTATSPRGIERIFVNPYLDGVDPTSVVPNDNNPLFSIRNGGGGGLSTTFSLVEGTENVYERDIALTNSSGACIADQLTADYRLRIVVRDTNLTMTTFQDFAPVQLTGSTANLRELIDVLVQFLAQNPVFDLAESQIGSILAELLGEDGGTCPAITITPSLGELEDLPSDLSITSNYGISCTDTLGNTYAGQTTINFTNLVSDDTLTTDINFQANQTTLNQDLTLDGTASGDLLAVAEEVGTLGLTLNVASMAINLSSTTRNLDAIPLSGTFKAVVSGFDLLGNQSQAKIETTSNNLTIGPYTVEITDAIRFDPAVCEAYPIAGTLNVSHDNQMETIELTSACDGTYLFNGQPVGMQTPAGSR